MKFGKTNTIVSIILAGVFLLSVISIVLTPKSKTINIVENQLTNLGEESQISVDENKEYKTSSLNGPLLAPFIDMASWVDTSSK